MERIWKLAVYIFWIIASTALIFVAYILSGNQYNEFTAIMVYAGLVGLQSVSSAVFIPSFPTVPDQKNQKRKNRNRAEIPEI